MKPENIGSTFDSFLLEEELHDRYQNQSWLIRRWRDRHYWSVPFVATRLWYYEQKRPLDDEDDWRFSFGDAWGIATGLAEGKMKYYFTTEEVLGCGKSFAEFVEDDG